MPALPRRVATLGLLLATAGAARAQQPALTLSGRVEHPATLTLAQLQAAPATTVQVTHAGHNGPATSTYTGTLLWALIEAAKPIDTPGRNTHLQHTLLARGADGYAVALALAELDPAFAAQQVLIAWTRDGKPLPTLNLVVPNDSRAGRSVRDLVAIEVF